MKICRTHIGAGFPARWRSEQRHSFSGKVQRARVTPCFWETLFALRSSRDFPQRNCGQLNSAALAEPRPSAQRAAAPRRHTPSDSRNSIRRRDIRDPRALRRPVRGVLQPQPARAQRECSRAPEARMPSARPSSLSPWSKANRRENDSAKPLPHGRKADDVRANSTSLLPASDGKANMRRRARHPDQGRAARGRGKQAMSPSSLLQVSGTPARSHPRVASPREILRLATGAFALLPVVADPRELSTPMQLVRYRFRFLLEIPTRHRNSESEEAQEDTLQSKSLFGSSAIRPTEGRGSRFECNLVKVFVHESELHV